MQKTTLFIHIAGAFGALGLSLVRIILLVHRVRYNRLRKPVFFALVITIFSGFALTFMSGSSMTAFCVKGLGLLFTIAIMDRLVIARQHKPPAFIER